MMHKTLLRSTLLAAAIGCAPLALAATSQQPATASSSAAHKHAMRSYGMSMVAGLKLTDAQRAEIRKLVQQNIREGRADMQPMRPTRRAFYDATPGSAEFKTAADKLATAAAEQSRKRVQREADLRTKIYGVLTPSQRTEFAKLRTQHEQQMLQQHMQPHASKTAPAASAHPAH